MKKIKNGMKINKHWIEGLIQGFGIGLFVCGIIIAILEEYNINVILETWR